MTHPTVFRSLLASLFLAFAATWGASPAAASEPVKQPSPSPDSGAKREVPAHGPTWQSITPKNLDPVPIRIEPDVLDFGDLLPDTQVKGEFKITNLSDKPLRIKAAMSSCACTVADLGLRDIEPGRAVVLPITFDSGKVIADQEREVVIRFEGFGRAASARVRARTNYGVRVGVQFQPEHQRREAVVTLESVDQQPFRVLSTQGRPPEFLDGFDPARDEPRNRYIVAQDLTGIPAELLPKWFIIETDHPTSPIIDIAVENLEWAPERTLRPWSFSERRMILGELPAMAQRDIVVVLQNVKDGGLDLIRSMWLEPPIAQAAIYGMEQTPQGLKVRVRITPNDDQRGVFVAALNISALDFDDAITLMARIVDASESAAP